MRVLLDTNVIIRLATSGVTGFSRKARAIVEDENTERLISAISITEIAMKVNRGKLALTEAIMNQALTDLSASLLPYDHRQARHLFNLPYHHRDPFDRMLICAALAESVPIVTSDRIFRRYECLTIIA
jgi:PIN domain nuclease of toxin-antitoxin system